MDVPIARSLNPLASARRALALQSTIGKHTLQMRE
jgi:hypothetical protein